MKLLLHFIALLICGNLHAQNVGIGTNKPLSKLHVAGDVRVDSLSGKDSGIVAYNNNGLLKPIRFSGNKDQFLSGDGTFQSAASVSETDSWLLNGNAGTKPLFNFIGTSDQQPLVLGVAGSQIGALTVSTHNISFGDQALSVLATGTRNIAIGTLALWSNNTGKSNIAIGHEALTYNNGGDQQFTGFGNIGIGWQSLKYNLTGSFNVAVGNFTLDANSAGKYNTAVGESAMEISNGDFNTAVGQGALWVGAGNNNTAVGSQALLINETSNQTAIGYQSLFSNRTGVNNTSTGYQSLYSNTTGGYNTSNGNKSLYSNQTGANNVANGCEALYGNTSGSSNVAIGFRSLLANTTGVSNTATGTRALVSNTTGLNNAAVGYGALLSNITGFQNTAIGMYADVTMGNLYNATAIGYNAKVNASNKVRIGNAAVTKIEGQVPFSTPSDGRYKFNVQEDVIGLAFIMNLRPVTYQFDVKKFDGQVNTINAINVAYEEAQSIRRTGFIAQEVEKAAEESHYNFNGVLRPKNDQEHYSLSYESFVVPLVKAMQEQQLIIQTQEKRIFELERKVDILLKLNN